MAGEHSRIDDGLKRKRYRHLPNRKNAETGAVEGIPANLDPLAVLELYLSRPNTSQIAAELGVRRKTLIAWLREKEPAKWKSVQIVRALIRKEDGDEGLEDARDALSLGRAREMLRSAQFDLERLDAPTWGQQIHQTIELTGDLGDRLRRSRERVIQPEPSYPQLASPDLTNKDSE